MNTKRYDFSKNIGDSKLNAAELLLACLAVTIGAAYIPVIIWSSINTKILTAAAYIAAGAFLAATAKIISNFKIFLNIAIGSVFLFFMTQINITALVLSLIGTAAIPAFLIYKTKNFSFLLPFVAGGAAAYAATGRILPSVFALFPVIPAIILYFSVKTGQKKAGTLAYTAAGYVVTIIIGAATILLLSHGKINAEIIRVNVESARRYLTTELDAMLSLMFLGGEGLMTKADIAKLAEDYVTHIFNYLPSLTVIISMVLAYLSHSVLFKQLAAKGEPAEKLREMNIFTVSVVSASVFLAMRITALILGAASLGMYSIAAQNLAIIIEPAMVLTAMIFIQAKVLPRLSCSGFMLFFGMFFLFMYLPLVIFPILSFTGAVSVIVSEIMRRKKTV